MRSGTVPAGDAMIAPSARFHWLRRRSVAGIAALLGLLLLWYLSHPMFLSFAGRWLDVGEKLKSPVDCVMVLGGDASTRPFLAAAIYRAGYANRILVPEVLALPEVEGGQLSEHELILRVLAVRDVPSEAVFQLKGPVDSTRDEANALAKYLDATPDVSVAIVTSNFHTRRVRMLFRKRLPKHRDRLHFVSCPTDGISPDNWWRFKDGILWYVTEYAKLLRDYWN